MTKYNIGRRKFVASAATVSAAIALGIKPGNILAQEGEILKVRMEGDIQVLDPGYMIGGAETTIQFATLPRLAVPVQDENGTWGWAPSDYVEDIKQTDDPLRITFKLKPGLMWSGGNGEVTAEDVKYSFERMIKSDWSGRWPTLDKVDVADKYSGTIVLSAPFVPRGSSRYRSESGTILSKAAVEKLPDQKFTTDIAGGMRSLHHGRVAAEAEDHPEGEPGLEGHQAVLQRSAHHRRRGEQGCGTGL